MAMPTTAIDRKPPDVERTTVTTLVELFARRASEAVDRSAVVDPLAGRQLTWGQLLAQALVVAERLEAAGLRRGDRVVHVGGHGADWIVVDFACLLAGFVQVALHADSPAAERAEQLQLFRPRALICSGSGLAPLRAAPALPRHEVRVDWSSSAGGGEPTALVAGLKQRAAAADPDAPATILISSGTTGRPRGFVHSQRASIEKSSDGLRH